MAELDELWADVGRRINALATELDTLGLVVVVTWDRPHGRVAVIIREPARNVD